ncbi:hypothetical protein [Hydrotalea sp.]|uniref:hypothetical protein n=1 Tax=Hydrotalea sp. TaxID=2881279 RepID=UPI002624264E|nr:hypothetical protein [Hydrotalea sp.]
MKTIITIIATFIILNVQAQPGKYEAAMGAALQELGSANDANSLTAAGMKFERIADAEKTQWLPYYYAALVKARLSLMKAGDDPDVLADEATVLADKGIALQNNSELSCVKSMIATAKMLVDPSARWMQYSEEMNKYLEIAKKQDTTNPRPYTLQANNLINTPEQFGGGCSTALPLAQKAEVLYTAFKPSDALNPVWGKEMVERVITKCK